MNAVATGVLGAGIGVGVVITARAVVPRRVPLAQLQADFNGVEESAEPGVVRLLGSFRWRPRPAVADQLRVLDKPAEKHASEKTIAAGAALVIAASTATGLSLAGASINPVLLVALTLGFAVVGFVYPDLPLASQTEARRGAFRHAFSAYLDLVTIMLAGGAGTESALQAAADAGDGWAFAEIRRALRAAHSSRTSPWQAFDQLGIDLGIPELSELAASISLAGDHGARVKSSLVAKADALRAAQAAQIETAAEQQTERMIVPVSVMILGLVLFIGFGAVNAITDGGTTTFAPDPGSTVGPDG